jgi:hypothetical protein
MRTAYNKLSYGEAKKIFEDNGFTLLDKEYVNNGVKMQAICCCGNITNIRLRDVKLGRKCRNCMAKFNSENNRTKDNEIKEICEKNNCKFIESWIRFRKTRIKYICKCGRESEAYLTNFKRYPNCKKCGNLKVSGANCHMYDPDREAVNLRKKFRKMCEQHIRRFMNASGGCKTRHTHELLGYTPQQLQVHILSHQDYEKCKDKVWHVDHIFPIKAFLDHGILDLKIINALENLRPMLGPENISKADNYDEEEFKRKYCKI